MQPVNQQLAQQPKYQPGHQQGVALITALLIVALATIVSVSISTQLQLDVRRTGNMIASEQAMLYTLEAESWSRRILKEDRERDSRDNNIIDHTGEDWATELPPIPVKGGTIEGKLRDLQACFNLNSLIKDDAVNPLAEQRFRRLLSGLPTDQAFNINLNVITQSIIDWIDDDLDTSIPDGAEDTYYMNLERPYRPANSPIQSISELRLVRGFEESKTFDTLQNLVCAFGVPASINVNTAPAEVLESLASNINAENIINEREEDPFSDMKDFIDRNDLKDIIKDTKGLSVSTEYFLLETESIIGQARTLMYSIIYREASGVTKIVSRSQGAY